MLALLIVTALALTAVLYAALGTGSPRRQEQGADPGRKRRTRPEAETPPGAALVRSGPPLMVETAEELAWPVPPGAGPQPGPGGEAPAEGPTAPGRDHLRRPPLPVPDRYGVTYLEGMALAPGRFYLYWEIGPGDAPATAGGSPALRLRDLQAGEWRLVPVGEDDNHRWLEARPGAEYLFELGYLDRENGHWLRTVARWGPARTPGPAALSGGESFPGAGTGAENGWSPGAALPGSAWGLRS